MSDFRDTSVYFEIQDTSPFTSAVILQLICLEYNYKIIPSIDAITLMHLGRPTLITASAAGSILPVSMLYCYPMPYSGFRNIQERLSIYPLAIVR